MNDRMDIGAVRDLKIDVLTETGWFDDARFKGGHGRRWRQRADAIQDCLGCGNAGGYAALLTVTLPGGDQRKILLDTGWNTGWMDFVFARHGVDSLLERGEIDFMVLSHWHLDHFWGIESTLKHNPKIKIYAPATWRAEDRALLQEKATICAHDRDGRAARHLQERRAPRGRTDPHGRARRRRQRPLPAAAGRGFAHVRRLHAVAGAGRERPLRQRRGQGHRHRHRLRSSRDHEPAHLRPRHPCRARPLWMLRRAAPQHFRHLEAGVRQHHRRDQRPRHGEDGLQPLHRLDVGREGGQHGVPIIRGTDAYMDFPKRSAQAKGSHAFLGNGDSVTF
jgi:7,8-dihydropterin-6-yl-methyl-4-(beta-D-ribofuranosyl)aminobenzene 5'-phosphate synthase